MGRSEHRREWTPDEVEWLRAHYDALGCSEAARRMGRTKGSVYERAYKLGLTRPERAANRSKRTPMAESELKDLYRKGPPRGSMPRFAKRWGIGTNTAYRWARDLGLVPPRGADGAGPEWTEEEDRLLEQTAHLSAEAARARFNRRGYHRTERAILHRRWEIRVSADDAGYMSIQMTAALLGVSRERVSKAVQRGDLKAVRRGSENQTGVVYIHRSEIRQWVKSEPHLVNRLEVDMTWLVDLLTEG